MVVSFHDISDKQVIKYIETCLQDKEKIKEVKKSVQKMKNIQEKKTNELKKIIKKSLKKIIKKSLKKSIRKSLKKTNTDKLITDIIKRLEDNIEDLSISDLVKKKIKNQINSNSIRDFRKKSLKDKYSRENQKCEQRNIFNCQKGYNSCRTTLRKGCVFDPHLQNELVNAILDECKQTECDCTTKERPYRNYYRGRKYCSDTPEDLVKLDLLASLTRFPQYMPFLNYYYYKLIINSFLRFDRGDSLYGNFIMIALIPSIFTFLKSGRQIMYEIDNQGYGKVFKKYCRTIGTSLINFPVFLMVNILSGLFCTIITTSILGPKREGGDIVSGIMREHNSFRGKKTQFRDYIFKALGVKGVRNLTVAIGGAGEEMLFRETLPKLLERIKPYLFKYYEKEFSIIFKENSLDNVEQRVEQTYTILLSSMSGLWFGLMHLGNLGTQDLHDTICQVVMATVVGCFLSYLRKKKGLATVWMIHFMNNYLASSLQS